MSSGPRARLVGLPSAVAVPPAKPIRLESAFRKMEGSRGRGPEYISASDYRAPTELTLRQLKRRKHSKSPPQRSIRPWTGGTRHERLLRPSDPVAGCGTNDTFSWSVAAVRRRGCTASIPGISKQAERLDR